MKQQEQQAFRPDLSVRFGRTKELRWNDFKVTDYLNFVEILNNLTDKRFLDPKIDAEEIVLIPYGPKGGLKKGKIIKAENSKYFECAEVIWKAKNLQESVNNHTSAGIGIYRIGFEKRLPSFYIGQYQDSAGLLTE
ncbi:hypothetical protein GXP67_33825 [Rhodocytophaga rosea]|uniref:Uncharacterized protein n=1 Tax=Rhodocytophaga rosea TaxID=2704465 RepID=A0A6C0GVC6_9BACT|nr:hypothetical protein [Rhodocytophaga rosea]QHT71282.1 hypothetical protein GXP67_33825 [Rhodocytophaga rosea]